MASDSSTGIAEAREKLMEYGLNKLQTGVYVQLVISGPMRLNEIADATGIYKMKAYRALRKLIEFEIVESTFTKPSIFSAVPPRRVVNLLMEDLGDHLQRLRQDSSFIIEALTKSINSASSTRQYSRSRIVQGRAQTFKLIRRMIRASESEVSSINTQNGIIRCVKSGLDQVCEERARGGVKLRWLTEANNGNSAEIQRLLEFGQVRHARIPYPIRLVIVDQSETVLSSVDDDSTDLNAKRDIAFWTNDRSISGLMRHFFQLFWTVSRPLKNISDSKDARAEFRS